MFGKDKEFLGIYLTEQTLKLAYLKGTPGKQTCVRLVKKNVAGTAEGQLVGLIKEAFQETSAKSPHCICMIAPQMITTKNIEIPSLDVEEIKSIIDLQAGRHTPYSREEIIIGYISIGVFQRNYTKVLLVIVNRDQIKKHLQLIEEAGLKVEKALMPQEAIASFYAKALNLKSGAFPLGIINLTDLETDFLVVFNGVLAMARTVPLGLEHLGQDPANRDKLLAELQKSLESYQNEDIAAIPEEFLLTGQSEMILELQPFLQDKLKAKFKMDPVAKRLNFSSSLVEQSEGEWKGDCLANVVLGAYLFHKLAVDLTPDEIKTQRSIEEKGRQVIKAGIFAIIILVMISAIFFTKIYFRSIILSRLEKEYINKHRSVVMLDRMAQRSRIIKGYLKSRMVCLDVVDEIYRLIPDEIYLDNIYFDENGTINVQGVSESMSRVFNFVSALEESAYFKGVKTKSTTAKKDRGKDVAAFDIVFRLESAKDESPEEEAAASAETPEAQKTVEKK